MGIRCVAIAVMIGYERIGDCMDYLKYCKSTCVLGISFFIVALWRFGWSSSFVLILDLCVKFVSLSTLLSV